VKNIHDQVVSLVAGIVDVSPEEIRDDHLLSEHLDVDSTEMVDIVVSLEKTFSINLEHGVEGKLRSVVDIVNLVSQKTGKLSESLLTTH